VEKPSRSRSVVKSNKLIQSSYTLTLQEARIVLLLSSMVNRAEDEFKIYRIKAKEFAEFIGIKNNKRIYSQLLEVTRRLRKRSLLIKEGNTVLEVGWLASSKYFLNEGYVELEFSKNLKPYLLQLKNRFTKYQLENVLRLKSSYSIRLYELSKQWLKLKTQKIEIGELRNVLGVDDKKYTLYGDFKRRVLMPAQREINEKTDISLTLTEIKKGKKVVMIRFKMKSQVRKNTAASLSPPKIEKIDKPDLYQRLIDYFLINATDALDIIEKYPESRILANLEYVTHHHRSGKIKNIAPYTLKAIKEDYRLQGSLFEKEAEKEYLKKREELHRKDRQEQLEIMYRRYRQSEIDKYREALSGKELGSIKKEAEKEFDAKYPPQKGKRRIGRKWFVRVQMNARIAKKAGVPTIEEWVKTV